MRLNFSRLSFDDLGHPEEPAIALRSIAQGKILGVRRPDNIFAEVIRARSEDRERFLLSEAAARTKEVANGVVARR